MNDDLAKQLRERVQEFYETHGAAFSSTRTFVWKEEEINDESIFVDILDEDKLLIYSNTYKYGIVIYINESIVNIKYSIINNQNENDNKMLGLYKSKTINDYLDVSESLLKNDNQMNMNEISTKKNMSMDESEKKFSLDQVFNFLNELN